LDCRLTLKRYRDPGICTSPVSCKLLKLPLNVIVFDTVQLDNCAADFRKIVAAGRLERFTRAASRVSNSLQFSIPAGSISAKTEAAA
jgi:hypothetical protein